jgi:1-phosphofructokinase
MTGCPIVTLTPAPTLDRTYFVHNLHSGGVNRADDVKQELAGKGINVSRALHLAGIQAKGVVPIGNEDPGVLSSTGSEGILIPLWVEGSLRVSTTIVEKDGPTTKVNEAPRPLSQQDWNAVLDLTERTVRENDAKWLVVAGALPVYKDSGTFVDLEPLFERMAALGVRVALDTSGEPLNYWARRGLAAIIKPNAEELASAVGRTLNSIGDVIDAGRELCEHGIEVVLASLGSDGMLAITKDREWAARTPPVRVVNTVGAGDATLAGFLTAVVQNPVAGQEEYGLDFNVPLGISTAVQWGAMAVTQASSGLASIDNPPAAILNESPDRHAALDEPAVFTHKI